jgi:hypothetical protein
MTMSLRSLLSVAVVLAFMTAGAPAALGAGPCPNEHLRAVNNSTALPDCRAYELVSPDLNHSTIYLGLPSLGVGGAAAPDGNTMAYDAYDASENAQSAQPFDNMIRAQRDSTRGWSGVSLSPPLAGPVTGYFSFDSTALSPDLSAIYTNTTQPLTGGPVTGAFHAFIAHADGTYRLLTPLPMPDFSSLLTAGNADFSHVYFKASAAQLPEDPLEAGNTYSWSETTGLHLLGILPGGTPAPAGATLVGGIIAPTSADASRALFLADGELYVRIDDTATVPVTLSQRTIEPDPNPGPNLVLNEPLNEHALESPAGITADGSHALFLARSELTNDAYTGRSGGVADDAGADLYSYDLASKELTDLTVDTNPVDAAAGANVKQVLAATPDGSYIYFTAAGDLAPAATPGHTSLYLWHEGSITFVADGDGLIHIAATLRPSLYVTPDGTHAVFASTTSLTGYDNDDPVTGQPHAEIYEATVGAGLQCVSCHANRARPTADTTLTTTILGRLRVASDDGARVFFESTDTIVPQATGGLRRVYEYTGGKASLISSANSPFNAYLEATSSSGDDVFFATFDELVPNPNGGDDAIYDARLDGGYPVISRHECTTGACRGPVNPPPVLTPPASLAASGASAGNLTPPASPTIVHSQPKPLTRAQKLARALKACRSKHNKKRRSTCEKTARRNYGRSKR